MGISAGGTFSTSASGFGRAGRAKHREDFLLKFADLLGVVLGWDVVRGSQRAAKRPDGGEQGMVLQAQESGAVSAHGKPCHGAGARQWNGAVVAVYVADDVLQI